jgi:putative metallohydrolase (TIGR04338 family)
LVVLHEVAHHLAYSKSREIAAHGPEFIAAMGLLVEIVIGPEVALVLRAAFDGVGV